MTRDPRDRHAATRLPGLRIDSCNLALRDPEGDGFLGDRASQTAFRDLLDIRRRQHFTGQRDPFGRTPTRAISKDELDLVLVGGNADAAHLVHATVEDHAARLAEVVRCFLTQPAWQGVKRIVIGGGFAASRAGALSVNRAARLLKLSRSGVDLSLLRHDSDDAGLLGWVPLAPARTLRSHAFLAVDIGGTNIRCGIVAPRLETRDDGSRATVLERSQWRHAGDRPDRATTVLRLAAMLNGLIAHARTRRLQLAPFVGIACPGRICSNGRIATGAQNLPGDWEDGEFRLATALAEHLDRIGSRAPVVRLHNDAVVQGLSERPRMLSVARWGVLTVGTGLGNASYTNLGC
ncbi:ROK family protein [Luteimonas deserti]|uniref:ROK family protein n=1 Tax=Luteimonas deserti TaxID=2752306 RepID=A0A7Z0TUX0_9GAMM|nr:ROK family protein [Luteimonas deserti]NYZ63291.1 ROK family protein [Luteimonas deserti]